MKEQAVRHNETLRFIEVYTLVGPVDAGTRSVLGTPKDELCLWHGIPEHMHEGNRSKKSLPVNDVSLGIRWQNDLI